jgi:hypothetical protein
MCTNKGEATSAAVARGEEATLATDPSTPD